MIYQFTTSLFYEKRFKNVKFKILSTKVHNSFNQLIISTS